MTEQYEQIEQRRDQILSDQIAWHRMNNNKITDKQIADFTAGFHDGWRKCLSTLSLLKLTR